jgi:hypothetical protein
MCGGTLRTCLTDLRKDKDVGKYISLCEAQYADERCWRSASKA